MLTLVYFTLDGDVSLYIYIYIYITEVVTVFDKAVKSHQRVTRFYRSNKLPAQRKERKDLTESTGVVPAKYPPKVKLDLFSQLQSAREG